MSELHASHVISCYQSAPFHPDLVFVRWITQKILDVIIVSTSAVIISQKSISYTSSRRSWRTDLKTRKYETSRWQCDVGGTCSEVMGSVSSWLIDNIGIPPHLQRTVYICRKLGPKHYNHGPFRPKITLVNLTGSLKRSLLTGSLLIKHLSLPADP